MTAIQEQLRKSRENRGLILTVLLFIVTLIISILVLISDILYYER